MKAGVSRTERVEWVDERRLGLHGQVRRVLAPAGVKVRQARQVQYAWRYLLLAVDPQEGTRPWAWLERLGQDHLRPVLQEWACAALIWDGAGPHRGKRLCDLPTRRVFLPPYAPELNPTERVFEEIREQVAGRIYASLEAKDVVVEQYLTALAAAPERVRRLCGWSWIQEALSRLSPPSLA